MLGVVREGLHNALTCGFVVGTREGLGDGGELVAAQAGEGALRADRGCTLKFDTTKPLTCWASKAGPGAVLQTLVARHFPRVDARRTMARPESSSISVSRRGSAGGDSECTVVWLRGEHDLATKVCVVLAIARAAQRDDADLIVDLSEVTFMDASTIGALVGSRNELRTRSQSLQLRAPSPPARRVLELCGLAHLTGAGAEALAHPTGAAAALGTWVDVAPSTPPSPPALHEPAPKTERRPTPPWATTADRLAKSGATTGAHRGGP